MLPDMSQSLQSKESSPFQQISDNQRAKHLSPFLSSDSEKCLPSKNKPPTRRACPYVKYRLYARHGLSLFQLLGFPTTMKDNPLEHAIINFIKSLASEARWVAISESSLCQKAPSSQTLAKEFLDGTLSDAKGREMWEAVGEDTLLEHGYQ
jgi:hypothetical protein